MEKEDILEIAEKLRLPNEVKQVNDTEFIWIYSKNRSLYLRLSDHGWAWYGRYTGWCQYMNDDAIMECLKGLAA